jgi:3-oxoacyl-[acyl-carrier-protein] synthase II
VKYKRNHGIKEQLLKSSVVLLLAATMTIASSLFFRRVVVTGMGVVTPLGNTLQQSWKSLLANECGVTTLTEALQQQTWTSEELLEQQLRLAETLPCQVAAPVKGIEEDPRTTRFIQLALIAGQQAMESAQLLDFLQPDQRHYRVGVSIGSGMSSVRQIIEAYKTISEKGIRKLTPHFVPKVLTNSAAGRLSIEYGLRGPNLAASTACAAGAHSIIDAKRCIQHGDADIMLAGGAEACIDVVSMAGFTRLRALSTNPNPNQASRPFDKDRDGFVMGEGAAILVLEELEHAMNRGAPILAELSGCGMTGDAHHITSPDLNGDGAKRAMQLALKRANKRVQYVNAHATSTPLGDEIEAHAIDGLFDTSKLLVSSTKGATGHLLGAAGAVEAAFAVQALVDKTIPATRNLLTIAGTEAVRFTHVQNVPVHKEDLAVVMSNSFGFGGTNASLVFSDLNA